MTFESEVASAKGATLSPIVILSIEEFGQTPFVKYVTLYVPDVEAETSTSPEVAFNKSPNPEENVPPIMPEIVGTGLPPLGQNVDEGYPNVALSNELMLTATLDELVQAPGVEYVTVYELGIEAARFIKPVLGLIDSPVPAENVPPAIPDIVGIGLIPLAQYSVDEKENEAFTGDTG